MLSREAYVRLRSVFPHGLIQCRNDFTRFYGVTCFFGEMYAGGMVNFVVLLLLPAPRIRLAIPSAFGIDMVYIAVAWRRYSAGMSGGRE